MSSGEWRWISDNSTVNGSSKGAWPWAPGEPNNIDKENCIQIYKTHGGPGRYNNVPCDKGLKRAGYICERPTEYTGGEGRLKNPQSLQKDDCKYTAL